jgi:hypothetical protein
MDLETAVKQLEKQYLEAIAAFKDHYQDGMETSDYYPAELDYDSWEVQFESFSEMSN